MLKKLLALCTKAYSREEKREPSERRWSKEEIGVHEKVLLKTFMLFETANYIYYKWKKVISWQNKEVLQGSYIDFAHTQTFATEGDVTQDDSQRRFLTHHSVAMLEQCWNYLQQCRSNVATLCCAKIVVANHPVWHHLKGGTVEEIYNS